MDDEKKDATLLDGFIALVWNSKCYHKVFAIDYVKGGTFYSYRFTPCGLDSRVNDFIEAEEFRVNKDVYRPCKRCFK